MSAGGIRATGRDLSAALALGWTASRSRFTGLVLVSVISAAGPATGALLAKLLLDELSRPQGPRPADALVLAAAGVVATTALLLLSHLSSLLNAGLYLRLSLGVAATLSDHTNRLLGLRHFEDPRHHNRLRLGLEAGDAAPMEAITTVTETGRSLLGLGGLVAVLVSYWPPMAALLILAAVPALIAELALSRRHSAMTEVNVAVSRRRWHYQGLQQDPCAAKEIRVFGLGPLFRGRMLTALAETSHAELAMNRRIIGTRSVFAVVNAAVLLGTVLVVVRQIVAGRLTLGDFALFTAAVAGMQGTLGELCSQTHQLTLSLRLFRHYRELLAMTDDMTDGDVSAAPLTDRIALRDVWFRYDDDGPWVLRGVTFDIPRGATVGLVGLNGAGKSTLVKLLSRFYDPQRGSISWDGVDLRRLRAATLRERLGVSHQDFVAYDLTARDNIGVGHLPLLEDLGRVRAAAERADVDETLAVLPKGYATMLSRTFNDEDDDGGVTLSGGQWQRVSVARSLMRADADLLILDEPTANLDAAAADRIGRTLRSHRRGRTTLVIAHRLSALRDADVIVVLRDGRVAEQGTHDELIAAGGGYAELFTLQARGYQETAVA
ncbi:ABC transporter ATP-binding protein [Actinoplanes sp. NPDC051861]|uniref:ABC transporter ATP-binding protein n=1 Tax=Actinoplanes sp. NPDC051861 TaxID=3155170 RepID=UPI003423EDEA